MIDKLYFIRREYKYKRKPNIENYDIWADYYNDTAEGDAIKEYLDKVFEKRNPGLKSKKLFHYEYWEEALEMMRAENKDISKIPRTAAEAFRKFVDERFAMYTAIVSNFDESKTILQNSSAAVNNLFFDFLQARLEDYDTFNERYTPGGFQLLKDAKHIMMAIRYGTPSELRELATCDNPEEKLLEIAENYKNFSPNYDPTELSTIAHYQVYNALYDNCISVAAVQNINQRLTSLLSALYLKNPVLFGSLADNYDNGSLSLEETQKLGRDVKSREVNGVDTQLLTTNFLASAVDAVKDALLEFFGIDDKNLNIACLMAKVGATPRDIGLLLNQPVVMEAMRIMKEGGGSKSMSNALDEVMQSYVSDDKKYRQLKDSFYRDTLSGESNKGNRNKYVKTSELIRYIGINACPDYAGQLDKFIKGQFAVVHLMKELQAGAQELAEQVAVTQSTSLKSVKSNFGAILAVLQKVIRFDKTFGGKSSLFNVKLPSDELKHIVDPYLRFNSDNMEEVLGELVDSPYCMEQIAFSAIMSYAEALGIYFPYLSEGFTAAGDKLAALTNRGYMSAELIDAHNKGAMMYFLQNMTGLFNESNTAHIRDKNGVTDTGILNRIFYNTLFPEVLEEILKINDADYNAKKTTVRYRDIPILGSISSGVEGWSKGESERHRILKMGGIGRLLSRQKDNIIESWEAMFQSDDPVLADLAVHLFMYSFYNRGFDFGTTTFMSLVPLFLKCTLNNGEYANFYNRVFNLILNPDGSSLKELGSNTDNIQLKDYCKAFILNTRKISNQFTKKLYPSRNVEESAYSVANRNMKTHYYDPATGRQLTEPEVQKVRDEYILMQQKAGKPYSIEDIDKYVNEHLIAPSSFTVNYESEEDSLLTERLGTPIKDEHDEVIGYRFTPCVEIDGAVYICDSNLSSSNNVIFNTVSAGQTMTYYRMDTPAGIDYSAPQLYGTRAVTLANMDKTDLIAALNSISRLNEEEQAPVVSATSTTSDNLADGDNVFGLDISTTPASLPEQPMISLQKALVEMKSKLLIAIERAKGNLASSPMELVSSIIAALINFSKKHVHRVKGKGTYVDDKLSTSVSAFIYGTSRLGSAWLIPSFAVGNTADAVGRDFFRGTLLDKYPNMSDEDLRNLISDLTKFRRHLDEFFGGRDNYRIVSDEFQIVAKYLTNNMSEEDAKIINGILDLIIYDKEGNLYLCDMKAKRSGISLKDLENYSKLLSLYKEILEAAFPSLKGKIKQLKLLKFSTYYEAPAEEGGSVKYRSEGPSKNKQLYANGIKIEESAEASYSAPRLTGDVDENYIDVEATEFKETFEAVDDFEIIDIVKDAETLVRQITEAIKALPSPASNVSVDEVIRLINTLESQIYNNFLVDSLPYLLGEDYRKEHLATMFQTFRSALKSHEAGIKDKGASLKDLYLNPMVLLSQSIMPMVTILSNMPSTPEIASAITILNGVLATLSALSGVEVTSDFYNILDTQKVVLTRPEMLEILNKIGVNEDIINSHINTAKTILKIRLEGTLKEFSQEGEEKYKDSNDGKPLCDELA